MKKQSIKLVVNGETRKVDVEPTDLLIDVLRDKLGLKTPKAGCGRGDCGACSVLMDGLSVRSCLILAMEAEGHEIITLEGLSKDGVTPLQEAFVRHNSFQCGFCAPGVILATTELLEHNSRPTAEDVREAISGNLCRCTGYEAVVNAVLDVTSKSAVSGKKKKAR